MSAFFGGLVIQEMVLNNTIRLRKLHARLRIAKRCFDPWPLRREEIPPALAAIFNIIKCHVRFLSKSALSMPDSLKAMPMLTPTLAGVHSI